jgi:uncharacterized repeat protein (TIGR03803 family)
MRQVGSTLNRRGWFAGARPSAVAAAVAFAVAFLLSLSGASLAQGQNYSVVYSFQCGPSDGEFPTGDLIADSAGNLYGTTSRGGAYTGPENYGYGTVFEISAAGVETVLHSFGGPGDGIGPAAGLVQDLSGNLYGTTESGGGRGDGTVFELSPAGTETILTDFAARGSEAEPEGTVLLDASGNLYSTTFGAGTGEYGTVFKLSPGGKITELHTFAGPPNDGANPAAGVIRDSGGNLYGTTANGGAGGEFNTGTVFEVSKGGVETVLYNFTGGTDGGYPIAKLVRDAAGNLYGTTWEGGIRGTGFCDISGGYGCGTVFKVTPAGQETALYAFAGEADGGVPFADLLVDGKGNLYGTTSAGGSDVCNNEGEFFGCGVVFEVTPAGKETVLHTFIYGDGSFDGSAPEGGLLRLGNYLYGTTYYGGMYGCGTVYKIAP